MKAVYCLQFGEMWKCRVCCRVCEGAVKGWDRGWGRGDRAGWVGRRNDKSERHYRTTFTQQLPSQLQSLSSQARNQLPLSAMYIQF